MKRMENGKLPLQEIYCLPVYSGEEYRAVQEIFVNSSAVRAQKKDASDASVGIFFVLYRSFSAVQQKCEPFLLSDDWDLFRTMCTYISKNYRKKVTLSMIADSAHVSSSKCCRLFRHFSSYSPVSFMNQLRLEQSCILLLHTELPVSQIAASCGFLQPAHFSRVFRKTYGYTPRQYRTAKTFSSIQP